MANRRLFWIKNSSVSGCEGGRETPKNDGEGDV
jgi:hypothetical protein